jgi:LuxR family maltose regulon positive regulatory protein
LQIAQPIGGMEREAARPLVAYVERLLAAFAPQASGAALQSTIYNRQSAMVEPLSDRELEVLRLITDGASNQAIATALMISIGTVKSHINHILANWRCATEPKQ